MAPKPRAAAAAGQEQRFQVQVTVRERPPTVEEPCWEASDSWGGRFVGPDCGQAEATERFGIYDMVDSFVQGVNCTVLAYGQTGSGKTHSMFGPPGALAAQAVTGQQLPPEYGLWPRAMARVLDWVHAQEGRAKLRLWAVEVYLDNVFDLLNAKAQVKVGSGRAGCRGFSYCMNSHAPAKYDENGKWIAPFVNGKANAALQPGGGELVEGQRQDEARTMEDVQRVGRIVEATRAAQGHALNSRSSRSHAIVGAVLTVGGRKSSWLFVDLAGSERVKRSEVEGVRMSEAMATNKSLSALSRVITALVHREKFVPFRDNLLTQMLSESLGTASRTAVVVTVSPAERHREETLSSLRFARCYNQVTGHVTAAAARGADEIAEALRCAEAELAQLAETRHAGGVNPDASQGERQSWDHNLQQLKHFRDEATAARVQLQGGAPEARAAAARRLALAQSKIALHEGVVARMIFSGLFKNPSPLMMSRQRRVMQLRQELQDATGVEAAAAPLLGGEMVLGDGLAGMIRNIMVNSVQG